MTRARIDVAIRIERDLAVGMPSEPNALLRIELLTLATPRAGDVVDDDPHPLILHTAASAPAQHPSNRACHDRDRDHQPGVRGALFEVPARRSLDVLDR